MNVLVMFTENKAGQVMMSNEIVLNKTGKTASLWSFNFVKTGRSSISLLLFDLFNPISKVNVVLPVYPSAVLLGYILSSQSSIAC